MECNDTMDEVALCDTNASASGIELPKNHVAPHFDCLDLRNAMMLWQDYQHLMVPGLVPMVSHD